MSLISSKQFLFERVERRKSLINEPSCSKCKWLLDFIDKEEDYKIDGEVVCIECYFEFLGEHPIGRITPHGGCC